MYRECHESDLECASESAVEVLVDVVPPFERVDDRQVSPVREQDIGGDLGLDVWPEFGYRFTVACDRHPFTADNLIDDLASTVSQVSDGHLGHAASVSRVRHLGKDLAAGAADRGKRHSKRHSITPTDHACWRHTADLDSISR